MSGARAGAAGPRDLRLVALVVAAVLATVALARCQGAREGRETAAAIARADTIQQLRTQLAQERATRDSMIQQARAAAAPHDTAQRATDRATRALQQTVAAARAAAARDSLALDEARAIIRTLADQADSLMRRHAAERATAAVRIQRLEATVTYVVQTTPTLDALIAAQARQAEAVLRRRPWIQRVLGEACTGGLAATGGGGGALVGGPLGAALGAGGGYLTGRLACR